MADKTPQPEIYLSDFLDSKSVSNAEKMYYMKHFAAPDVLSIDFYQKTSDEWSKITKIK